MKERKMQVITNARGVRTAWGEIFDALLIGVHTLARGGQLSDADRVLLVVKALKLWPDNPVMTVVDRALMIEDTASKRPNGALGLLADRDADTLLVESLFRPVLFASTLRQVDNEERSRLSAAIAAAGVDPACFGLAA